ncbi:MAG: exopolysaccharide biosynthesis polyprenyl glycosylphosphotransferase [Dysgonamonadaceae bacterium]|nr:exopolysaccharide biosynthesis polyprenyl glycosylphosphotransferase [Dysgonamonadaceae bacterium]MDD4727861.1 exopolysaccharide biosynthesis polyprenyl glycosylphosphotransferase [Dysgonamonadaceae bacterium]
MQPENKGLRFLFLILDISLLFIAVFIISYYNQIAKSDVNLYLLHATLAEIIAYTLYSKRNYYFLDNYKSRLKHITFRMIVFVMVLVLLAKPILPNNFTYQFLFQYFGIFYLLKITVFYFLYKYLSYGRKKGRFLRNIVILGLRENDVLLGYLIEKNPTLGFNLIGYIADTDDYDRNDKSILGNIDEIETLVNEHQIKKIFVTPSKYFEVENARKLLGICNKVGLKARYVMMNTYWNERRVNDADFVNSLAIYNPQEIPLDNFSNIFIKRIFDVAFSSLVILLLFSWLFPIIALIIKLDSKGPVFFVQKRTGIDNMIFNCIKFRTMQVNNDADNKQAVINDSRISRVGAILRKYNIDELPQFINVLLGEMSVVGPRPHMLKHTNQYSALINHYKVRHYVKPGVTGWAQVNGYRGLTDELWKMEKRVDYDMEYLKNWNFLWDIKIIFLTLFGKDTFENAM